MTREKHFHAHSALQGTVARSHSSEKHAPLQGAERKQLGARFFFCTRREYPATPALIGRGPSKTNVALNKTQPAQPPGRSCCVRGLLGCPPPPQRGGLDLNSSSSGCARLDSGVAPPLGVVEKEVAVLIALVRRHRRAVGAAVRRAVGDEVPGAVEEEAGPAAVRRMLPGLLHALPVHALGALGIAIVTLGRFFWPNPNK